MCDLKKCFASWVATLAVRVESHPLRHLFEKALIERLGLFASERNRLSLIG